MLIISFISIYIEQKISQNPENQLLNSSKVVKNAHPHTFNALIIKQLAEPHMVTEAADLSFFQINIGTVKEIRTAESQKIATGTKS